MQGTFDRVQVLNLVLVTEIALLIVATIWCVVARIDLLPLLEVHDPIVFLIGTGVGLLMCLFSLILTTIGKKLKRYLPFLASLEDFVRNTLGPVFREVNPLDILLIAVSSGFCEEVLFRGVLQQQFGLVIASAIFGLFHFVGKRYLIYVVWAGLAGAFLGYLANEFHSLWVPICAHMVNNFLSIVMVRYEIGYKRPD